MRGLLAAGMAGLVSTALVLEPPKRVIRESDLRPVLLRPGLARVLSRPYLPLLLDVYWLRALNAVGDPDSTRKNRALYDYGRVLTELDPRFLLAYTYLGLNIPFQVDRNQYVNGDLASDLFRRGLLVFPAEMKLHLYLGFNLFYIEKKYAEASEVFARGARLPGAPRFMGPLAARLLAHDGRPEDALNMTRQMLASAEDDSSRAELAERVQALELEVLLSSVDRASQAYQQREGHWPSAVADLQATGDYAGPTTDPSGERILIRPDGTASSASLSRRYRLFESP